VGERPAYPYATDWNGRRFSFLGCSSCGSTFIDPVPTDQDFEKMYSRANYHAQFYDTVLDEGFRTSLTQYSHLLPSGGRILDFGCGNGAFLIAATKAGYQAEGVELEQTAREEASRASGCEVLSFEEVTSQGRTYDIIHMGDVLEHLPDPAAMMEKLRSLLNAGGVFFIEGPLDDNASLVFWASRAIGAVKRQARPASAGDFVPFHLFRTGARAQRDFFEEILRYRLLAYDVFETGWPYASSGLDTPAERSLGSVSRRAIAKLAVIAARASAPAGVRLGNRFSAVLSPS
jgi:SAM-dependent methyltransferase